MPSSAPYFVATLILLAGVVDDLRSRKVHNWLVLVCAAAALVVQLLTGGLHALPGAFLGGAAAIALMLPLVMTRIVGAGDMKILAAFGLAVSWNAVLEVIVFSVLWGGAFGLVRIVLKGQARALAANMASLVVRRKAEGLDLHQMPYTVALFVGWLTYLTREGVL